jgi:hypothetical protein
MTQTHGTADGSVKTDQHSITCKVEPPVPHFKVFPHFNVPFHLSQLITMMLNFLHLRYSSV